MRTKNEGAKFGKEGEEYNLSEVDTDGNTNIDFPWLPEAHSTLDDYIKDKELRWGAEGDVPHLRQGLENNFISIAEEFIIKFRKKTIWLKCTFKNLENPLKLYKNV